ncbi:hypothetical protein Tco_0909411, partial [Tanacetum coccineum]
TLPCSSSSDSLSPTTAVTPSDVPGPYTRAAPLSIMYPPTTSKSLSEGSSFDSSTLLSERSSHLITIHSPTPSAGPSRKRCRSPATLVTSDMAAEAATAVKIDVRAEAEVKVERDDEAKDNFKSISRGTIEIRVDVGAEPIVQDDIPRPIMAGRVEEDKRETFMIGLDVEVRAFADERERARLRDRVSMLERSVMRLRDVLSVERERADSVQYCLDESKKGDDNRNGNNGGNGNNGNNNNRDGNHGGNVGGAGLAARECTYKEFLNC